MKTSKYSLVVKIIAILTLTTLFASAEELDTNDKLKVDSALVNTNPLKISHVWQIDAGAHLLKTTHKTHFKGVNVGLNYVLSNTVSIGVGLEYSNIDFHNDNGWELRNLQFLPVYLEAKVLLKEFRKTNFYLRPAAGITMMRYTKANEDHSDSPHTINEQGLYLNLATGISYDVNKRIQPLLEVGFKGFKNSLNDLDVNPHGLTLRLGLLINAF